MALEALDALYNRRSNFKHPKIHPARELRLVTLQNNQGNGRYGYTFTVVSFADLIKTNYYALSYTWGLATTENDIEKISVEGQDFWVRRTLFNFTCAAYESSSADRGAVIGLDPTVPIFIDAICINQLDAHEKSRQVMQMADVYKHANQVITYLGHPHCEDADFAHEIACRLAIFNSKLMNGPSLTISGGPFTMSPLDVPEVDVVTRFTQEDLFIFGIICRDIYWTRLWIVPEVLLAPQHWVVWCGTQLFDGHLLAAHLPFMLQRELRLRIQEAGGAPPPNSSAWRAWHMNTSREARSALYGAVDHMGGRFGRELLANRFAVARQPGLRSAYPGDLLSSRGTALLESTTLGSMKLRRALQVFKEKRCFDPRDKLYGLLPMLSPRARARIDVNYKKDEIYVFENALRVVWEEMSTACELRGSAMKGICPALEFLDQYDDLLVLFDIRSEQQTTRARLVARKVARELGLRSRWQAYRDQFAATNCSVDDVDLHFDFLEWGCTLADIRAKLGEPATDLAHVHHAMMLCKADAVAALCIPSEDLELAIRGAPTSGGPRLSLRLRRLS